MAFVDPRLVAQYAKLHQTGPCGNTSLKLVPRIRPLVREIAPASILDYGCGQSSLLDHVAPTREIRLWRYDPAIPAFATLRVSQVDLVICTDVLEHIPEADLADVVGRINDLSAHAVFSIDTSPSEQVLPDGTNAHCTVRPAPFWRALLADCFGTAVPIRSGRSTKCMFKTWVSPPAAVPLRFAEFAWLTAQRKLLRRFRP